MVVVTLGPLTNLADVATDSPEAYSQLAIHALAGSLEDPGGDLPAELNAAADPTAFKTVLATGSQLTLVPANVVPEGRPDSLSRAPVVSRIAALVGDLPWWDLAAAVALVAPDVVNVEAANWKPHPETVGLLEHGGEGSIRVVTHFNPVELEAGVNSVFDAD